MWSRRLAALLALLLALPSPALAAARLTVPEPDQHRVVVVYSGRAEDLDRELRLLDLLLGHFTGNSLFFPDDAVDAKDLAGSTHLVYFGYEEANLPQDTASLLAAYDKPFLAIGHNVEQLGRRFAFANPRGYGVITGVSLAGSPRSPVHELSAWIGFMEPTAGQVLLEGWDDEGNSYPLMVRSGDAFYLAISYMGSDAYDFIGYSLFDFFGEPRPAGHHAYIRLEDIHPASDPVLIKEIGDYLYSKGIPFTMIVIPVYTNPDTMQQIHLHERPRLVAVLRQLQSQGGSVVLHGYTHQYRASETGEGFEFWDVENNTPVYAPADEPFTLKGPEDFATAWQYERYMRGLRAFERDYTIERIKLGNKALLDLGLIPLAFEAPHYTMSQQGYSIVAQYYTHIFGQIQLTDRNWEYMSGSPYVSRPAFLHGLTLLPENIGYYDITSPTPLEDMIRNMERMRAIPGSMLGMFYHPYLGLEPLIPVIEHLETFPDLQWLDLTELVDPDLISIIHQASLNPLIALRIGVADFFRSVANSNRVQKTLWGVTAVTTLMVGTFVASTLANRAGMRRRLFQEEPLSHG